jgi:hypothetical protein
MKFNEFINISNVGDHIRIYDEYGTELVFSKAGNFLRMDGAKEDKFMDQFSNCEVINIGVSNLDTPSGIVGVIDVKIKTDARKILSYESIKMFRDKLIKYAKDNYDFIPYSKGNNYRIAANIVDFITSSKLSRYIPNKKFALILGGIKYDYTGSEITLNIDCSFYVNEHMCLFIENYIDDKFKHYRVAFVTEIDGETFVFAVGERKSDVFAVGERKSDN